MHFVYTEIREIHDIVKKKKIAECTYTVQARV